MISLSDITDLFNNSSSWRDQLQTASFNGVPFVVDGSTYTTGRRVAIHEYPYRDNPWIEDLGLNRRAISFQGFLVGDDCYKQRDKLKDACEKFGNGVLIHPSMGRKTAALVNAGFAEGVEKGRVVSINFEFVIVDDKPRWPTANANTKNSILQKIKNFIAAVQDVFQKVRDYVNMGLHALHKVLSTIHSFINLCLFPLHEASAVFGIAKGLFSSLGGSFSVGRFAGSFINPYAPSHSGIAPISLIANTTAQAISTRATLQASTTQHFANVLTLADPLAANTSDFTSGLQVSVETLRSSITDPNDQVRLLSIMAKFNLPGADIDPIAGPTAALCRRIAIASLAIASAAYTPNSQADALTLQAKIRPIFDDEIQYAADKGDTDAYVALRSLRSDVMNDLQTRGSMLPPLITTVTRDALPSLMLAWNMYGDSKREVDLLSRNQNVIHPLFFDTKYEALSA